MSKKWERREQLGTEEVVWISDVRSLPAKVYANIKTHKDGWPYRYIVSWNQTVIENLARWVEYQLKYLSRKHSTYLKDTKHFLSFIEDLNEKEGPFKPNEITVLCRDISNFYPSCNTRKCREVTEDYNLIKFYEVH